MFTNSELKVLEIFRKSLFGIVIAVAVMVLKKQSNKKYFSWGLFLILIYLIKTTIEIIVEKK